jgi:tetratricopeptide (TPR) repeat protein
MIDRSHLRIAVVAALIAIWAPAPLAMAASASDAVPARTQEPVANADLLFDQGKRHFDAVQYDEAVAVFDKLIASLTAGGQAQRPEVLVQAYELRARARFALNNSAGAEQDFSALLAVRPDYKLATGVSPRVVALFESVRKLTIGQASIGITPGGDYQIDGRTYTGQPEPAIVDLTIGEHELTVTRSGFAPVSQRFTIVAGSPVAVSVRLERISAMLEVVTVPAGVEVLLDGASKGRTSGADRSSSGTLVLKELPLGSHTLLLRRDCYLPHEQIVALSDDVRTEPIQLSPAVATARIETTETAAAVFVDGEPRGLAPADLTLCQGTHVLEVRTPKGRFVDRREWKTGETATLKAEIRSAFPIVAATVPAGVTADQLRENVERALARSSAITIYAPLAAELQAAMRDEKVSPDFLNLALAEGPNSARVPKTAIRDAVRKLSTRLGVQGISAIAAGSEPFQVSIWLMAAGSSEPDVIALNLTDPASQARALEAIAATAPAVLRISLDATTVDLQGVKGATVVRAGPAVAKAGLAVGDVVVGAGGKPVASVADLRAALAALPQTSSTIVLDVTSPGAAAPRKVNAVVATVADTIPLRDRTLLYNKLLLELQDRAAAAVGPVPRAAAQVNLAIAHMRLGNWDESLNALKDVQLPEGAGVSAGTIAYLTGLAHEGAGRVAEAQAAFARAATATQARLGAEGPLVAPLAQAKLRR